MNMGNNIELNNKLVLTIVVISVMIMVTLLYCCFKNKAIIKNLNKELILLNDKNNDIISAYEKSIKINKKLETYNSNCKAE